MITSKLPNTGTNIFTVMSQLASSYNAINLAQGFPDFQVSEELISLVHRYMKMGMNQYAPMPGVPALREAIAEKIEKSYDYTPDPEKEITITAGATEALYASITAIVREEDEVIMFDPSYDCYAPVIKLNHGIPIRVKLSYPEFRINWEEIKGKITRKTRAIIINSPHNPSGTLLQKSDLLELENILSGRDIIVISDEVYQHIIFDQETHQSVLRFPELRQKSMAVFSFGKTFHATGWKVGYVVAPEEFTKEIRKIHQFLNFSVNTPVQYALADYIQDESNYMDLPRFYQEKRDMLLSAINGSRFSPIISKGTYFQLFSYSKISDQPDTTMAEYLTKEHGVATIPVSVFYADKEDNKVLRLCFSKHVETLEKAAEILCKI
jgi:methionine aminotransferase